MRNAYRLREIGHMSDQSEDKILKLKKTHPLWRSEDSFEHVRQRTKYMVQYTTYIS